MPDTSKPMQYDAATKKQVLREISEEDLSEEVRNKLAQGTAWFTGSIEKPRNKTYTIAYKMKFAGTLISVETQLAGTGSVVCSPTQGSTIAVNDDITLTVSGTNATTGDLRYSIEVEKA